MDESVNRRVLVIDDNEDIHTDFRKILVSSAASSNGTARSAFLGKSEEKDSSIPDFELASATQGEQGINMAMQARRNQLPFAMAFVDVRMPPGLDGVETIERLWQIQPDLQVVICTAFADYSFEEIIERLGANDNLLILKKPFEPVEVRQMASALTNKWNMRRQEHDRLLQLGEAEREAREFALAQAATNRALEEANKAARAASRAKSDFLANMSHEIRTPMNAILGYLDLLFETIDPNEEQNGFMQTVNQSGKHLLMIVDDVLDISRIEAGKLFIVNEQVSPIELCKEVISISQRDASDKGLELDLQLGEGLPESIQTDPNRLRQILLNLIGNGLKFTSEGSVQLQLSCQQTNEQKPGLRFRVLDTGPGISPENQEGLFEPFTQVDSSMTRHVGGTGLGLAISQRLANALSGEVTLESEVGKGSAFDLTLEITAHAPSEAAPASGGSSASASTSPKPAGNPNQVLGSVLVVEDVAVNQLLIRTMLEKAGSTVTVAGNGQIAVDAVEAATAEGTPHDLILMDMQMPVMDGYEATRQLRAKGVRTPIVALTAHAMTTDRDKCVQAGCDDYITKPVDRQALIETCARLLAENPRAALPAPTPTESPVQDDADTTV